MTSACQISSLSLIRAATAGGRESDASTPLSEITTSGVDVCVAESISTTNSWS